MFALLSGKKAYLFIIVFVQKFSSIHLTITALKSVFANTYMLVCEAVMTNIVNTVVVIY